MSRPACIMRRRPARVLPATITALTLLAIGGILAWGVGQLLVAGAWPDPFTTTAITLAATPLSDPLVLGIGIGLVVVGGALLLCAAIPGRHHSTDLALDTRLREGAHETVITDRAVGRIAAAHAGRVDGVESVTARAHGHGVTLTVHTPVSDPSEVTTQVEQATHRVLDAIPFQTRPKVSIKVERSGS